MVRAERSLEVFNGVVLEMMARDGARDGLGVSGLGSRIVTAYSKAIERQVKFRKEVPGRWSLDVLQDPRDVLSEVGLYAVNLKSRACCMGWKDRFESHQLLEWQVKAL